MQNFNFPSSLGIWAGWKGLTSGLSFVVSNYEFVTPIGILGQVLDCIDPWSLNPYLLTWLLPWRQVFSRHGSIIMIMSVARI